MKLPTFIIDRIAEYLPVDNLYRPAKGYLEKLSPAIFTHPQLFNYMISNHKEMFKMDVVMYNPTDYILTRLREAHEVKDRDTCVCDGCHRFIYNFPIFYENTEESAKKFIDKYGKNHDILKAINMLCTKKLYRYEALLKLMDKEMVLETILDDDISNDPENPESIIKYRFTSRLSADFLLDYIEYVNPFHLSVVNDPSVFMLLVEMYNRGIRADSAASMLQYFQDYPEYDYFFEEHVDLISLADFQGNPRDDIVSALIEKPELINQNFAGNPNPRAWKFILENMHKYEWEMRKFIYSASFIGIDVLHYMKLRPELAELFRNREGIHLHYNYGEIIEAFPDIFKFPEAELQLFSNIYVRDMPQISKLCKVFIDKAEFFRE